MHAQIIAAAAAVLAQEPAVSMQTSHSEATGFFYPKYDILLPLSSHYYALWYRLL
jgi:hypothetical protein